MGYRSSVHLGINNSAVEEWLTHLATNPKAFEVANHEGCMIRTKHGLYLNWEYVKWYNGYPEVDQVEDFLSKLESLDRENEFAFFRMGEEYGDSESRGHSDSFEFYPVQQVEVHYEEMEKEEQNAQTA